MILILSTPNDVHAQAVGEHLDRRAKPYRYFSFTHYPHEASLSLRVPGAGGRIHDFADDSAFDLPGIRSVWHRRPGRPAAYRSLSSDLRKYAVSESRKLLDNLEYITPEALWVSLDSASVRAELKPYQLVTAESLGFRVPDTYIGNDAGAVREFAGRYDRIIVKPLSGSNPQFPLTPVQKIVALCFRPFARKHFNVPRTANVDDYCDVRNYIGIFTNLVESHALKERIDDVRFCPAIFQEPIRKKLELRITVVGKQIFPCALIHGENMSAQGKVDWRMDQENLRYEPYRLAPGDEAKVLALLRAMNLQFGCLDMIVTPEDELVFLEINPSGQWLWIEQKTGMPIAHAIADLLTAPEQFAV